MKTPVTKPTQILPSEAENEYVKWSQWQQISWLQIQYGLPVYAITHSPGSLPFPIARHATHTIGIATFSTPPFQK